MPTTPSGCGISRFLAGMNCTAVATRRGAIHFFRCLTVCLISPSTNIDFGEQGFDAAAMAEIRRDRLFEAGLVVGDDRAQPRQPVQTLLERRRGLRSRQVEQAVKGVVQGALAGLFSDWSMAFSSAFARRVPDLIVCSLGVFRLGLYGRKAGPLRKVWQERSVRGRFGAEKRDSGIWPVIKSSKVASQPFPKRACVGTYRCAPRHSSGVAFSGSLRTD